MGLGRVSGWAVEISARVAAIEVALGKGPRLREEKLKDELAERGMQKGE